MLGLPGTRVTAVPDLSADASAPIEIEVALTRRALVCPHCDYSTMTAYDRRPVRSSWRHLDLAARQCLLMMARRRLRCPEHGVTTEGVPFARPAARFTRDFEDLIAWLVTRADKTTVASFARIVWRTVGAICERISDEIRSDTDYLAGLVDIGVDEISWRKHHKYLTMVTDHDTGKVVWGTSGKNAAAFAEFFTDLGADRTGQVEAITMDLGLAYQKTARERAPQAVICFDGFHVVQLATTALDEARRQVWQSARRYRDKSIARLYKGARWALLKNPGDLTVAQTDTLNQMREDGGTLWQAYELKESLRAVFAGDLTDDEIEDMLDRWIDNAAASGIPAFEKTAATIAAHRAGITAALHRGLSNGRHEGRNNHARTILRRAYGFHSAEAAFSLLFLACGPVKLDLPYHTRT